MLDRVDADGTTDNTFGTSGEVRHDLSTGSQDVWNGMAYTFDGKLVVSGVATGDFALGRFGAGGSMLMGANPTMSQRLWFQQDANFNVTSVSNDAAGGSGGVAVERYVYAAYGERTVLHSDFTPVAGGASLFGVDEGHQGLSADAETGLVYNRHRYLHVTLGRFTSPDPHPQGRYVDGMSGYEYVRASPVNRIDPPGLSTDNNGVYWDPNVDWLSHPHRRPDGWIPGKGFPPGDPLFNTPLNERLADKTYRCKPPPCSECDKIYNDTLAGLRLAIGGGSFAPSTEGMVVGVGGVVGFTVGATLLKNGTSTAIAAAAASPLMVVSGAAVIITAGATLWETSQRMSIIREAQKAAFAEYNICKFYCGKEPLCPCPRH